MASPGHAPLDAIRRWAPRLRATVKHLDVVLIRQVHRDRGGRGLLHAVGFDLGTSGLKAVLVDEFGRVVRSVRRSYPLQTPVAGWAEQDPELWWRALLVTSRTLLDGVRAPDAVGLTGQMHSAVALGPGHAPLGPAILWNDQRTVRECAELRERIGGALATWTGNPIRTASRPPRFSGCAVTVRICTGDSAPFCCPRISSDCGLPGCWRPMSRTLRGPALFDVHRRRWSEEALEALEIQRAWMPEVHESAALVSGSIGAAPEASALPVGTPVAAGRRGPGGRGAWQRSGRARAPCRSRSGRPRRCSCRPRCPCPIRAASFRPSVTALPGTWQLLAAVLSGGGSLDWYQRLGRCIRANRHRRARRGCRVRAAVQRGGDGPAGRRRADLSALPHGRSGTASRSRGSWRMVRPDPSPRPASSGPRRDRRRRLRGPRRGRGRRGADGRGTRDPGERRRQPRRDLAPDARQTCWAGGLRRRGRATHRRAGLRCSPSRPPPGGIHRTLAADWAAPGCPIDPEPEPRRALRGAVRDLPRALSGDPPPDAPPDRSGPDRRGKGDVSQTGR